MICFLINRIDDLKAHQTTARLIEACVGNGHTVALTDIFSFSIYSSSDVCVNAVVIEKNSLLSATEIAAQSKLIPRQVVRLREQELVVVRTSPGRDLASAWAHQLALQAVRLVRDCGIPVVNDPVGLQRASSKLYSACLAGEFTPATLVAHDYDSVAEFVRDLGKPAVIKPLLGSGGRDVFFVDDVKSDNLRQVCEILGRTGYVVVQEYLPEAAHGDLRVLVLDGEILTVSGAEAVVHRVPRLGEFRSNVALGADVKAGSVSDEQRRRSQIIAKRILEDGIRFAGLDLVGDLAVEVNVYSTGGLVDIERFHGVDFASAVMSRLLRPA